MKRFILMLMFGLCPWWSHAQLEIVKSSLAPLGGSDRSDDLEILYAGGELANREAGSGDMLLSEGFITPDLADLLGVDDYTALAGVRVYPNPTSDFINLHMPEGVKEIELWDLQGRRLWSARTDLSAYRLDLRAWPGAVYLLVIIDRQKRAFTTYRIQKIENH